MSPAKLDYKKQFPNLYRPSSKKISILEVPSMQFFMIDGRGDPNTAQAYQDAITCLYAVSYALKMKVVKKQAPTKDYVVPPLEGLWYKKDMADWSMDRKEDWQWTMMIRIPDFVSESQIAQAIEITRKSKDPAALPLLYHKEYREGLCMQLLHLGPYEAEPPNIAHVHQFAEEQGYILAGRHHEIYLSDPRRVDPEKLKTILRQPIKKK